MSSQLSIRDAILAADDLERVAVEIPEWGQGPFYVRALTGAELGELETFVADHIKADMLRNNYRGLLVIASLFDESGKRIFTFDDLAAVNGKSAKVMNRIVEAADGLTKLSS